MEVYSSQTEIYMLPNELLIEIFDYISIKDSLHFASTCKQYNELVRSSQSMWRNKMKKIVNKTIFDYLNKIPNINWHNEIRNFCDLKTEIYSCLIDMADTYYTYCTDNITLNDIRSLFNTAFKNGIYYYSTIFILQELYKKASQGLSTFQAQQPYTLTEMHYAKVILEHLMHAYLTIKWTQRCVQDDLPPEIVLNFFLQWVDPLNFHADEDVSNEITELATMVEMVLQNIVPPKKSTSIKERCECGDIKEDQIHSAISHVIYVEKKIALVDILCLDTLNIQKVLKQNVGHAISIAVIYQAVAKRFGLHCELVSFPSHFFLEWHPRQSRDGRVYKIALDTGIITPKGVCPFARANSPMQPKRSYDARSFLQFVISTFTTPIASSKSWLMKQALYLMDFLPSNQYSHNRYNNYFKYLRERTSLPALTTPIDITQLTDDDMRIIVLLSHLTKSEPDGRRPLQYMRRSGAERFAVGMVCRHARYEYACVVRGWESKPRAPPPEPAAARAPNQSFYIVIAADSSHRFIGQEDLVHVPNPERVEPQLEDELGKEFSHFNGFSYVPNGRKRQEYPDDLAAAEAYATRAHLPFTTQH